MGGIGQKPSNGEWVKGKLVGCGSFGNVHLAMNKTTGGLFVVKSQHSGAGREALDKEVKMLTSLKSSPYIVECLGSEEEEDEGGKLNVFMEYMAGGSLADVANKFGGWLDEEVIRVYTREILNGLKHIHKHGIVHCDIKCKNVLLGSSGNVKLGDFGCAKRVKELGNSIGGTPLWMAPEVLRNEAIDFSADIWSLGCTVIEMATGNPPWSNQLSNPITAVLHIAHGDNHTIPQFPPHFSKEGLDFLTICLNRQPNKRSTVDQLLNHPFVSTSSSSSSSSTSSPPSVLDFPDFKHSSDHHGNPFSITFSCHHHDTFASSGNWITVRSG